MISVLINRRDALNTYDTKPPPIVLRSSTPARLENRHWSMRTRRLVHAVDDQDPARLAVSILWLEPNWILITPYDPS
jgi:hypothetical protein